MKVKSESELNIIRTKILVGDATKADRQDFLYYVGILETLLEEAGDECEELYDGKEWHDYMREKHA